MRGRTDTHADAHLKPHTYRTPSSHHSQPDTIPVSFCSIAKQANLMALHHDMLVREPLPPPVPPPPQHLFQRIQAGLNKGSQGAGAANTTTSSANTTTDS